MQDAAECATSASQIHAPMYTYTCAEERQTSKRRHPSSQKTRWQTALGARQDRSWKKPLSSSPLALIPCALTASTQSRIGKSGDEPKSTSKHLQSAKHATE